MRVKVKVELSKRLTELNKNAGEIEMDGCLDGAIQAMRNTNMDT
jgi:hypothetical protein